MPVYQGHVVRVLTPTSLEVDILVDRILGVLLRRVVDIDGIPEFAAQQHPREVIHCLVVLCGGRDVELELVDPDILRPLRAKVFLPWCHPLNPPVAGRAEVGPYIEWAEVIGYDAKALRHSIKE